MGICKFIEEVCETVKIAFMISPTIGPTGPAFPIWEMIKEKKDK